MRNDLFLDTLTELGLSDNEAKVYFAALSLGPSSILKIAVAAEIKRTTVYTVAESLIHQGLMRLELKGWKKSYVAEAPENLENILENKRLKLKKILPEFSALYNLKSGESFIRYYQGVEGVKNAYENLLKLVDTRSFYYVISDTDRWEKVDPDFFLDYRARRAEKVKTPMQMLLQPSDTAQRLIKNQANVNAKAKLLPPGAPLTTNLIITSQQVLMHQMIPPILAIVIENKSVIQMHKEMFEIMWRSLAE